MVEFNKKFFEIKITSLIWKKVFWGTFELEITKELSRLMCYMRLCKIYSSYPFDDFHSKEYGGFPMSHLLIGHIPMIISPQWVHV
jgi:hypothetical protein